MFKRLVLPRLFNLKSLNRNYSTRVAKSTYDYTVESVKLNDFNIYLSTLLAPEPVLRSAFALRAFNIELLSLIRSSTNSRSQMSLMKLQFWKDQIEKLYQPDVKLNEPISNELRNLVQTHKINKAWLNRLIDGRKQFFSGQFKTLDNLETCADMTTSTIYLILLKCMNVNSIDCDHVASHLGKCELITSIVRNLMRPNTQSVYYLPLDMLVKHKISQQDFINYSERNLKAKQQEIKDLTFELATRAFQHLNSARHHGSKIKSEIKPLFVSSYISDVFLAQLEKCDFDLMNPKLKSDFRAQISYKLMLSKLTKSF